MTNSSPSDTTGTGEWILGSLTAILVIAGAIILWRVHVATNALILLLAAAGWGIAAWLAWTDRQRHRREQDARDRADRQARARDRYDHEQALGYAITGNASRLVSDADRDAVCRALGDAHADGRLPLDEHDQRSTAALHARHPADLRATLEGLL